MAKKQDKRFERVYVQSGFTSSQEILVDRETGVQYLIVSYGTGSGITPLIGADGKPLLYQEEKE